MPVFGWVALGILASGLVIMVVGGQDGTILGIAPEQLAAVTTALALLVFLLGGDFGRQKLGPMLGQALIWAIALVALVVGYLLFQRFAG